MPLDFVMLYAPSLSACLPHARFLSDFLKEVLHTLNRRLLEEPSQLPVFPATDNL